MSHEIYTPARDFVIETTSSYIGHQYDTVTVPGTKSPVLTRTVLNQGAETLSIKKLNHRGEEILSLLVLKGTENFMVQMSIRALVEDKSFKVFYNQKGLYKSAVVPEEFYRNGGVASPIERLQYHKGKGYQLFLSKGDRKLNICIPRFLKVGDGEGSILETLTRKDNYDWVGIKGSLDKFSNLIWV